MSGWQRALQECAERVDRELPALLGDLEPATLRDAVRYYPDLGGKRLRPALTMIACEAAGGTRDAGLLPGIASELIHNFSLVHDDIMDEDEKRRGAPTAHVKFGLPTALLAGDALFAKAFGAISRAPARAERRAEMLAELVAASLALCEGQQRDMDLETAPTAGSDDYYLMIAGKTGRLFECSAKLGGLAADAAPAQVEALALYGRDLGRAFQVRDDVLDLAGDAQKRGKPWANDVRRGKRTIICLLAFERARGDDLATLRRVVGRHDASDAEVRQAVDVFEAIGALRDAQGEAQRAAREAQRRLAALPKGEAREALEELARFSAEREK